MEIILDTNFIIELVKQKIDLIDIENYGNMLVPEQVLNELARVKEQGSLENRKNAEIALKILRESKKIKIIRLESRYVDLGIMNFLHDKKDYCVATIDRELKNRLKGKARILTIINRKKLVLD